MPGKGKCRVRAFVVIGALTLWALAPSLAPAVAGNDKGNPPPRDAPQGAIGVKGVSQASPGFAEAQRTVAAERPAPLASEPPSGLESRVGSLPFTGWDLIILGGVATALTGMGFLLHRLATPRTPHV